MKGKKTSDEKIKKIAQAKAIKEDASSLELSRITGVPASTIRNLIRNNEKFVSFINKEKKRLKIEYIDLIKSHVNQMREKLGRASYRDIVGGFKIVHEKAFPEDQFVSSQVAVGVNVPVSVEQKEVIDPDELAEKMVKLVERIEALRQPDSEGNNRADGENDASSGN